MGRVRFGGSGRYPPGDAATYIERGPMNAATRPLAIVTGASSGIGLELARECARHGFDLVIGADRSLDVATQELKVLGVAIDAVQVDLATPAGVDRLVELAAGRPVDPLLANPG